MSTTGSTEAAPLAPTPEQARTRRQQALAVLGASCLVTGVELVMSGQLSSFVWTVWRFGAALGLYFLWLSTPRLGSARFQSMLRSDSPTAVWVAFLLGSLRGHGIAPEACLS